MSASDNDDTTWPRSGDIAEAAVTLRDIARETPLIPVDDLSARTGYRVYVKAENLQRTGSYKVRGAYVKLMSLNSEARQRGVICASAGNHGQGVALAARLAGVPATIVLPCDVPLTKLTSVKAQNVRVVLVGNNYDEAYAEALAIAEREKLTFVHPFDDWDVIRGQGTVGKEIIAQVPEVAAIVVPVGGGGLLAGISLAVKAAERSVVLAGVQAQGASAMVTSYQSGVLQSQPAHTVADGIRVRTPGSRPFAVIRKLVDQMLTVTEEEIYRAVVYLLEHTKLVAEPAGAVALAAVLNRSLTVPAGSSVVAIVSGGNVDPNLLTRLIEYGLAHSARYLALRIRMPDRPGQLLGLLTPLADLRVNVLNIEHRRSAWGLPVDLSEVMLHLETRGAEHRAEIMSAIQARGYNAEVIWPDST